GRYSTISRCFITGSGCIRGLIMPAPLNTPPELLLLYLNGARPLAELNRIVDTYLSNRSDLEPLTLNELSARLHDPELIILDVRPHVEYAQGHIAGARSIPIDELEGRLSDLSPEQEIVAYCRGPYCVFADEAIEILTKHGYHARRIQKGYPDWLLADL